MSVVAAFDFDGTITDRDTLLDFLFYLYGKRKVYFKMIRCFPSFYKFLRQKKTRQEIKEEILTLFFKGIPYEKLKERGIEYSKKRLPKIVRAESLEKIRWHLSQKHHLVIVSAAIDLYLHDWAEEQGFSTILSSKLEVDGNGLITGKLEGINCWGPEKVRRLRAVVGDKKNCVLYAYGDSRGDRELLQLADYPFYRKVF